MSKRLDSGTAYFAVYFYRYFLAVCAVVLEARTQRRRAIDYVLAHHQPVLCTVHWRRYSRLPTREPQRQYNAS